MSIKKRNNILFDVVKSREINMFWWFYKLLKSRNSPCNRTQNPAPVVTFWRGRSSLFASNPANSANLARKMICVWKLDELASVEWCSHVSFLVFYSVICPKQTVISMECWPAARGFRVIQSSWWWGVVRPLAEGTSSGYLWIPSPNGGEKNKQENCFL